MVDLASQNDVSSVSEQSLCYNWSVSGIYKNILHFSNDNYCFVWSYIKNKVILIMDVNYFFREKQTLLIIYCCLRYFSGENRQSLNIYLGCYENSSNFRLVEFNNPANLWFVKYLVCRTSGLSNFQFLRGWDRWGETCPAGLGSGGHALGVGLGLVRLGSVIAIIFDKSSIRQIGNLVKMESRQIGNSTNRNLTNFHSTFFGWNG